MVVLHNNYYKRLEEQKRKMREEKRRARRHERELREQETYDLKHKKFFDALTPLDDSKLETMIKENKDETK